MLTRCHRVLTQRFVCNAEYKGNAYHCLRPGAKRRRTQEEVIFARKEETDRKKALVDAQSQVETLQA